MVAIGECLFDVPRALVARALQRADVGGGQAKWLFTENVLAGCERSHRPLDMQMIGNRNIERLDLGVVDELVVGTEVARNAELLRDCFRLARVARRDADKTRGSPLLDRRNESRRGDRRRAQHAPTDRFHVSPLYRARQCGLRFSAKARGPSSASSLASMRSAAGYFRRIAASRSGSATLCSKTCFDASSASGAQSSMSRAMALARSCAVPRGTT